MKRLIALTIEFLITALLFGVVNYFFVYHGLINNAGERKRFILATLITSLLFTVTWHSVYPHFLNGLKRKQDCKLYSLVRQHIVKTADCMSAVFLSTIR